MKKTWKDYNWQLIHTYSQAPNIHMALDALITKEVNDGLRHPTLRIWEWASPAIVLGRFQSIKNEVNQEKSKEYNIEIVRRITGGGAMFIEPGNTITYSISAPINLVNDMSFQESYKFLDDWVIKALIDLGVPARYKPINDIESENGKKIGGAAQARFSNSILHHVTIAYSINQNKMLELLRIGKEKISDKGIESANKRVDDSALISTGFSREHFIKNMIEKFSQMCSLERVELDSKTIKAAKKLSEDKFKQNSWINIVP
ncbi:lipoate-protein ligase A [Candidatus Kinetoplastibacterium desouzaii TCC079E]|uniref:Lipoate-protein ligase A n=1 Tax=Candidatus Kinetoplastidibacterium desouzai TCC079E TaxID=1208919 RepID=M1LME7_9PROT|nr:biotin/lipoate A/B protein ligase family protein [Candidatus Kinetoplastibacterium desouzaii]AGF46897.1 lipoate-protein ligase A [Candidatus Kinetoplastibacterium desouzaii TCC079E]